MYWWLDLIIKQKKLRTRPGTKMSRWFFIVDVQEHKGKGNKCINSCDSAPLYLRFLWNHFAQLGRRKMIKWARWCHSANTAMKLVVPSTLKGKPYITLHRNHAKYCFTAQIQLLLGTGGNVQNGQDWPTLNTSIP